MKKFSSKMQSIAHFQFTKLHLSKPSCIDAEGKSVEVPFSQENTQEMRFVRAKAPYRPPQFILNGSVKVFDRADEEYGGKLSILFKPSSADIANLEILENVLNPESEYYERFCGETGFDGKYEFQPTLTENYDLRIKLHENDEGKFKFETTLGDTEEELGNKLIQGAKISIVVCPGFYFNDSSKKYGMYLTLKSLTMQNVEDNVVVPAKRVSSHKRPVSALKRTTATV